MDKGIKEMWVAALRSGQYKQAKNYLKRKEQDSVGHCCLGVLCEIAKQDGVELLEIEDGDGSNGVTYFRFLSPIDDIASAENSFLPYFVADWAGLNENDPTIVDEEGNGDYTLSQLNDYGRTFAEIADLIEAKL